MDEASDLSNQRLSTGKPAPKPGAALPGWCALAEPIVRSISFRLGYRYWLQPCHRQDLEQQIWLELLVRHGGRDSADDCQRLDGRDVRSCRDVVRAQLRHEIGHIAEALTRSWPFWRRLRPAPERALSDNVADELTATDVRDSSRRHDLSLDVIAVLAALPSADRSLCESLMAGDAAGPSPFDDSDHERRVAALQDEFTALDLHEYL
jgi:hypothetical protein